MAGLAGARLGAYELVERIGGGGMAEVYRARQSTAFGREVAVKVIRPGFSEDSAFRERFLREAEAISRLAHPHILPLIEFGQQDDTLYLVMPLIHEGTLLNLLRRHSGPLSVEEALPLFTQLCSAVHYAHTQGIVHRDLKPQNVLLQQGTHVLLADFGIARDRSKGQVTTTGMGLGSADYMAPEQVLGKADTRSDIYSLGVLLYQILTGALPYTGDTPYEVILKHHNAPVPEPRTLNPTVPPELAQIIQTALAKNPAERFQSAQALGRAVQHIQGGANSISQPSFAPQPAPAHTPTTPVVPFTAPAGLAATAGPVAPATPEASEYATRPAPDTPAFCQADDPYQTSLQRPTQQNVGAFQPGGGDPGQTPAFVPAPAPGYNAALAPGYFSPPSPPPPSQKKARVRGVVLVGLAVVLVLVGSGILAAHWLSGSKTGPGTPTATPSSFLTSTSPDHTFRVNYPRGWNQLTPSAGTGVRFEGPGNASFEAINQGNLQTDAGQEIDFFCVFLGSSPGAHKNMLISHQTWAQESCNDTVDNLLVVAEALFYQGNLYLIDYEAPPSTFNSIRTSYFAPMESSFQFLQ